MNSKNGFTLIETIIGLAVFAIVSVSIYTSYSNIIDILIAAQSNFAAIAVASNEIEVVRNIPYPDVGLNGGSPQGSLKPLKTVIFDGAPFTVTTSVKNIDDPFDGTINSNPKDLIPADYKIVEIYVNCSSCAKFSPVKVSTIVAPRSLEKATRNGALFINVTDASGNPVVGANVSIINNTLVPPININDITNVSGSLNFVDIATSSAGYRVSATKSGYSTERTYPPGDSANPNPYKPDATVSEQGVTSITLAIDRLSNMTFKAADKSCVPQANLSVTQTSSKLIGYNPDVPKYSTNFTTDSNGSYTNSSLEWDTYDFTNNSPTYDLIGYKPSLPLVLDPNTTANVSWIMTPKAPNSLLVTLSDENDVLINDATVELSNGTSIDQIKTTGHETITQTDWSAGDYTSKSAGIDAATGPGTLKLTSNSGQYVSPAEQKLVSKTFDMGTSNITYFGLAWNPQPQPSAATLRFQIATNNDNATWNFGGPNGSSNTYYTTSGAQTPSSLNNKRYIRYKVFMKTTDPSVTPILDDLAIEFKSDCLSDGQAFFSGLPVGTYTLTISKSGYNTNIDSAVDVTSSWQEYQDILYVP